MDGLSGRFSNSLKSGGSSSAWDRDAAEQVGDIECYEDEGSKEYCQQYDEVGQVVISLLLFSKEASRLGHHATP